MKGKPLIRSKTLISYLKQIYWAWRNKQKFCIVKRKGKKTDYIFHNFDQVKGGALVIKMILENKTAKNLLFGDTDITETPRED